MKRTLLFPFITVFYLCLVIIPHDVHSIWCFQCNSAYHNGCADIKPNDTTSTYYKLCEGKDLEGKELFCRKLIQKIHDRDGLIRVIRRCGWAIHTGSDCYSVRLPGHEEHSCQCFTDGCNSGNMLHYTAYTSVLLLFTTYLLN